MQNRARWLVGCVIPLALAACGNDAREKELTEQLALAREEAQAAKASAAEARREAAKAASNDAGLSAFYGAEGDIDEDFAPEPDDMPEEQYASDEFDNGPDINIPGAAEGAGDFGGDDAFDEAIVPEV